MTPEEKRKLLKRQMLKDALTAEQQDEEITPAVPPADAPRETTLKQDLTDAALAASQGMTGKFGDEAVAGIHAVQDVAGAALGQRGDISLPDAYRTNKNVQDRFLHEGHERSPYLTGAAEIGGALTSPQGGETAAAKILSAAAQGAVTGLGSTPNMVENPRRALIDTALGGAFGAGGQALGGAIADEFGAQGMKKIGEESAKKAVARSQSKAMENMPENAGRELIDSGVVTFGAKAGTMAARAEIESAKAGKALGKLMTDTDAAVGEPFVDGSMIAARIRQGIDKFEGKGNEPTMKAMEEIAQHYEDLGKMTFAKAQKEKISWKFSRNAVGDPIRGEAGASNAVKAAIGGEIEDAFDRLPAAMETKSYSAPRFASAKSLKGEYKALNSRYAATETAEATAANLAGKQDANLGMGLREMLAGSAVGGPVAFITHDPVIGLASTAAAMLASKLAKERGPAALAIAADRASRLMNLAPQLIKKAPVMKSLVGPELGAVHMFMMDNDPAYKIEAQNAETKMKAPRVRIAGLPLPAEFSDDPFFKHADLAQAILAAEDGSGQIRTPEALAQLSGLISGSDDYDTVQKATMLTGIGKNGRVNINIAPEAPAMIQRPMDEAPPTVDRQSITNALKAVSGG